MKAILLVRVSTQQQSLESQRDQVRAEAIKDGFTNENIIVIEDKESAVKLSEEERNGLNKLKWHIEHDDISTVYTYEVSRISRQPATLYNIRDYLIAHHVQLIIIKPYMKMLNDDGTLSSTANIFFGIFSSMAENEGFLRKERVTRGAERKRNSLEHAGGVIPYGYTVDKNGHYVIVEEEAEIIRRIYTEYADGLSLKDISKRLQSEGYKSDIKNTSLVRMIFRMLHKEYYAGDRKHPAIVTQGLYDRVQTKCDKQRTYHGENVKVALLKGLLYSEDSGYMMGARFKTNQYVCNMTRKHSCKMSVLDMIVLGVAREWYNTIFVYRNNEYKEMMKIKIAQCERIINQQTENITKNQDKIDRIEERYIDGKISKEKADSLEHKAFEEMQEFKKLYNKAVDDKLNLERQLNEDRKSDDARSIVVDMVESVYYKRLSKTIIMLKITNKHTGEKRTFTINGYNGDIKNMSIDVRQGIAYKK